MREQPMRSWRYLDTSLRAVLWELGTMVSTYAVLFFKTLAGAVGELPLDCRNRCLCGVAGCPVRSEVGDFCRPPACISRAFIVAGNLVVRAVASRERVDHCYGPRVRSQRRVAAAPLAANSGRRADRRNSAWSGHFLRRYIAPVDASRGFPLSDVWRELQSCHRRCARTGNRARSTNVSRERWDFRKSDHCFTRNRLTRSRTGASGDREEYVLRVLRDSR